MLCRTVRYAVGLRVWGSVVCAAELRALVVARVQGLTTKSPAPSLLKLTVPWGVVLVGGEVSVTVAVQIVGWATATERSEERRVGKEWRRLRARWKQTEQGSWRRRHC